MPGYLTITTLGGHNINDGVVYLSRFLAGEAGDVFTSREVIVQVLGEFPTYVRSQPEGRTLVIYTRLLQPTLAALSDLRQWCNPRQGQLELQAQDELGRTLRLFVKPVTMRPREGASNVWELLFWVAEPVWEQVTESAVTQIVTSSGQTWLVNNGGEDVAAPQVVISPMAYKPQADAPRFMRHVVVANRSPLPLADANGNPYPVEITGGGWNVEAEVTAGRLHPQGYDLDVYVNGVRVNRYLSNFGAGYGLGTTAVGDAFRTYETAASRHAMLFRLPGCAETEVNSISAVEFALRKVGAPMGSLVVQIRQDANGLPGTVISTSAAQDVAQVPTTFAWVRFSFASTPSLKALTWYWLELDPSDMTLNDNANYIEHAATMTSSHRYEWINFPVAHSTDGVTWYRGAAMIGKGLHGVSNLAASLDFRVFTTGTAKIWVPMLVPAGLAATLEADDGSASLSFSDDLSSWPESGAMLIDSELIIYASRSGRSVTATKRGARGTAATVHQAGAVAYLVDMDVRLVFGRQANMNPSAYEPRSHAPVIAGAGSANHYFVWTGPFLSPRDRNRPMAWVAQYDDSVAAPDLVSLDLDAASDLSRIDWEYAPAKGTFVSRNAVMQHLPTGIKQAEGALNVAIEAIPAGLVLEHLLTNEWAQESTVALMRTTGGSLIATPEDEGFVYRLRARPEVLVGTDTPSAPADDQIPSGSGQYLGETFTLSQAAKLTGIAVYVRKTQTLVGSILASIHATTDGTPDEARPMSESVAISDSEVSTTYQWITKMFTTPISLPPGTYALLLGGGSYGRWARWGRSVYAGGMRWVRITGWASDPADDVTFRILGDGTPEVELSPGGDLAVTAVRVSLDDVTPRTPQVVFETTNRDLYLLDGAQITNQTTGQTVQLRALMQAGESLTIDFAKLAVTHSDDDLSRSEHMVAIEDMDEASPFVLAPGDNTLAWTDPGVTNTSVQIIWRDRFL